MLIDLLPRFESDLVGSVTVDPNTGVPLTVTEFTTSLAPGSQAKTILGHATQHSVLSLTMKREGKNDTTVISEEIEARADLWTAADLPFSWLAYAYPPFNPRAAVPTAQGVPAAGLHLIDREAAGLEALGLLLRAETSGTHTIETETNSSEGRMRGKVQSGPMQRTVEVVELMGEEPVPTLPTRPLVPYDNWLSASTGLSLVAGTCAEGGKAELNLSGDATTGFNGNAGAGEVGPAQNFREKTSGLTFGKFDPNAWFGKGSGCLHLQVRSEKGGLAGKTFPVVPVASGARLLGETANAILLSKGPDGSVEVTTLTEGSLTFGNPSETRMTGELTGAGHTIFYGAKAGEITEDVAISVAFGE